MDLRILLPAIHASWGYFPLPNDDTEREAEALVQALTTAERLGVVSCTVAVASTTEPNHYIYAFSGEAISRKNSALADFEYALRGKQFTLAPFADQYKPATLVSGTGGNVFCAEPKLFASDATGKLTITGMSVFWFSNCSGANPYSIATLGEGAGAGTHMLPCPECIANSARLVDGRVRDLPRPTPPPRGTPVEESKAEEKGKPPEEPVYERRQLTADEKGWKTAGKSLGQRSRTGGVGHGSSHQYTGRIKTWKQGANGKFGFITYEGGDIYFNARAWKEQNEPVNGQNVTFYKIKNATKDDWRATNVRLR